MKLTKEDIYCICGGEIEELGLNHFRCQKCESSVWINPNIPKKRLIDRIKTHLIPSKTIWYTTPLYSRYRLFKKPPFNLTIYRSGCAKIIYNWFGLIKITIIK